jgi:hypothetical protein
MKKKKEYIHLGFLKSSLCCTFVETRGAIKSPTDGRFTISL